MLATGTHQMLDLLQRSCEEVFPMALGHAPIAEGDPVGAMEGDTRAALITLVGEFGRVQLGLATSERGSREIAGHLLGMEADDPELVPDNIEDAIGELMNILAGHVKQLDASLLQAAELGLPLVVEGHIKPTPHQELLAQPARIDNTDLHLVVLVEKRPA